MDFREIGIDGLNWIWLAYDRIRWWAFVNMVWFCKESRLLFDRLSDYQLLKEYPAPWSE
jgi:hypothetical protein